MKCNSLEEVREQIDQIDDAIIRLIAERGSYVVQASMYKKDEKAVVAPNRVELVLEKVRSKAEEYGAIPDMVEALYREMITRFVNMELEELKKSLFKMHLTEKSD